jgi:hypothetical protein
MVCQIFCDVTQQKIRQTFSSFLLCPGSSFRVIFCVAPSELFFKAYFASVLAKFPSLQLFFTPSLLGKGIKKGLPGVASLLILCAAAWPSPPG